MSNQFVSEKNNSGTTTVYLSGELSADTINSITQEFLELVDNEDPRSLEFECSGITYCNTIGISFFNKAKEIADQNNINLSINNLDEKFNTLLNLFELEPKSKEEVTLKRTNFIEDLGESTRFLYKGMVESIAFMGHVSVSLLSSLLTPNKIRWNDVFLTGEKVGANAIGIIALVNFLVGLVISFQSAIPLEKYGGTIFVADLLVLSTFRELGPLMTAIVVNGRTGSAFAAEIGTMKVNEEIDALTTMGLDPVKFLVIPKIIASIIMIPILTIFGNLFALIGGLVVMLALGFPPVAYLNEIVLAADYVDLLGGLFKSLFFALTIASIGCLEGLNTLKGPAAVGDSTTSSVVKGLVMIIVLDGIFGVIYFYIGI